MVKDEIRAKETILCGKCPDLKIRHHFGRKAVKGALFIAEIREETVDFTTVSYQAATEVHFARIQRCGIYNAGFECLGGIWNGRIRGEIAEQLGFSFSIEIESGIANQLRKRLEEEEKLPMIGGR
ncbi:hypothetical protein H0E87_023127 [Populus deltoides]|uniref:Uncharacterized protein n=1 Tax=Populus deltoides TaxID=3696 RepID=A0A8T2XDY9_POPDE|nr:hypothetical protein H0E87_023127 [Populus deltoides]